MSGNLKDNIATNYQKKIAKYTDSSKAFQKQSVRIGWIRFGIFLAILFFIYRSLTSDPPLFSVVILAVLIILFAISIKYHLRIKWMRSLHHKLLEINTNEYDTLHNDHSIFSDGEKLGDGHRYAEDLDIFGPGSLFHYLNRCGTRIGISTLSGQLMEPYRKIEHIKQVQDAIRELSPAQELRQHIFAHALLEEKLMRADSEYITFTDRSSLSFHSNIWKALFIIWPIIMTVLTFYFIITVNVYPLSIAMLLALLFIGYYGKETQKNASVVSGKSKVWNRYAKLFELIDEHSFNSIILKELHDSMHEASLATKTLGKIGERYDSRLNLIVMFFLNVYLLWDLRINRQLFYWLKKYEQNLNIWIKKLGQFEALASLSTFQFNHPSFTLPTFSEHTMIGAQNMGHPLIPENSRIHNDCEFGPNQNLFIITGSNMAGKSTFLRTLGINCILAQIGTTVCAEAMTLRPFYLQSSIRLSDSLQEDTSFFFAELKKLKGILDDLQAGIPTLILLDEVLKGTNSEDKVYGAEQLIKNLIQFDALTFLATHILSLGGLEKDYPNKIVNYCFESTIEDNELHFDYKLKSGIAQHKNATFLMRKMGIIQ